ncbi:acyltransferase family protein [Agrococcus jejuensis]|uniref:Peptidoglycan/LPS O-acetylase OafA/YrhL, contains acyltransferase and SGNH-hydrolase domains n=1 Tax=Agrococcus jejuensis TaxID=399736 RepID=A0A1G8BR60_9MICO|nr:acyltransferase family protein [Agrococcus jejuensis]SDH35594.1 Peptidoglycan/LPS O-acetylase OafA/YrhL, contains acyltransferase and SGNH-hydrolase domains [Agrococcus jejuensis]
MTAPASPIDAAPARARRLDVQGLRAVASLLVASYHIWFGTVSGGVDVFFVLGGYLLVTSLVGEVERSGRLDVGGALRRQASRLLPMMGLVLAAVAVVAYLVRPATVVRSTSLDLIAAATFWENWRLRAAATDYVQAGHDRSIVQHFWAMAVQGQWTLGIIVAIAVLALVLRRRRGVRARIRPAAAALLAVVATASFAYALVAVSTDHVLAYFDTGARVWELALGGLAALLGSRIAWSTLTRTLVGAAGLATMLLAGLMPVEWSHPGLPTLVPTLAAVAVLLAGSGVVAPVGVGRLLATKQLVWLGGISFGLYLWHWPVLWLYLERGGARAQSIGIIDGAGILVVSVALAWLSTLLLRAVARPVPRIRVPWSAVAVPTVVAVALGASIAAPRIEEIAVDVAVTPVQSEAELDARIRDALAEPGFLLDGLDVGEAGLGPEWRFDGCSEVGRDDIDDCTYVVGEPGGGEVWVVGDSQATTWAPAVRAAVDDDVTVQLLGSEMCPFAAGAVVERQTGEWFERRCADHNDWVVELAQERSPSLVVVSYGAWWVGSGYEQRDDDVARLLAASTARYVEDLVDVGVPVLWLDSPPPAAGFAQCIDGMRAEDASPCAFDLQDAQLERRDVLAERLARAGATVVPTLGWFCDLELLECPIVVSGVPVYADDGHMTWAQSLVLQRLVREAIDAARVPGSA